MSANGTPVEPSEQLDNAAENTEETPTCDMPKEDIKRNMKVCILLDSIWELGWQDFAMARDPLLIYLGASNALIGAASSLSLLMILGMVLSPWITLRFPTKKWYLFVTNIPMLAPIGILGLIVVMSPGMNVSHKWLLTTVFIGLGVYRFFAGFVALPHQEYIAACIPGVFRGRFTGYSFSIGALASLASAYMGKLILEALDKPVAFGYLFLITWFICQSGYVSSLFARESRTPVEQSPSPWSKKMFEAAWNDKPFVRFVAVMAVYDLFIGSALGFVTIYGYKKLGMMAIVATAAFLFQTIPLVTRIIVTPLIGHIADRFGPRRVFPASMLINAVAFLPLFLFHNSWAIYISIAISELGVRAIMVSTQVMAYGLVRPKDRAGHFTFRLMEQYIVSSIGAVLVGYLCDVLPFKTVFLAAIAGLLFMAVFSWVVFSKISDEAVG